jgi:cellobiose phosphorylase
MDYNSTLQWLQQLLGTQQQTNASQFGQALTSQQQALADTLANQKAMQAAGLTSQQQMQQAGLGEQGREFDASTALQKVIADWQNQLANKQQAQSQQGQQFGQSFATRQYNDSRTGMTPGQLNDLWQQAAASSGKEPTRDGIPLSKWSAQQNPLSSSYAYGIPSGNGFTYNPYTGKNIVNYNS